jgi:hypothetical protein
VGNGLGGFYQTITVEFKGEKSASLRQFSYQNSLCGSGPCHMALELGDGKILVVP